VISVSRAGEVAREYGGLFRHNLRPKLDSHESFFGFVSRFDLFSSELQGVKGIGTHHSNTRRGQRFEEAHKLDRGRLLQLPRFEHGVEVAGDSCQNLGGWLEHSDCLCGSGLDEVGESCEYSGCVC
jgi:hypothetical protein